MSESRASTCPVTMPLLQVCAAAAMTARVAILAPLTAYVRLHLGCGWVVLELKNILFDGVFEQPRESGPCAE